MYESIKLVKTREKEIAIAWIIWKLEKKSGLSLEKEMGWGTNFTHDKSRSSTNKEKPWIKLRQSSPRSNACVGRHSNQNEKVSLVYKNCTHGIARLLAWWDTIILQSNKVHISISAIQETCIFCKESSFLLLSTTLKTLWYYYYYYTMVQCLKWKWKTPMYFNPNKRTL